MEVSCGVQGGVGGGPPAAASHRAVSTRKLLETMIQETNVPCLGCRVVLVGDPQQLPATVLSRQAQLANMERSMFERFQRAGCPVTMLSVQYRMHPSIRQFPSQHFYNNQLQDG